MSTVTFFIANRAAAKRCRWHADDTLNSQSASASAASAEQVAAAALAAVRSQTHLVEQVAAILYRSVGAKCP